MIVTRHGKPTVRLVVVRPEAEAGPVRMRIETFPSLPKIEELEVERDRTPWGDTELDFD